MRLLAILVAISMAVAGCNAPAAAGRTPLPAPPMGSPGAPGTSRADLDRTIRDLEGRLATVPADASASVRLADALLRQARVVNHSAPAVKAERVLRDLLARETGSGSHSYQAQRLLAVALASQHRFEEAIREAERCLQVRPDDALAYGVIGDAKLELGDRPAAFAAFDRMMMLRPDAASYARMAYARELTGDPDTAIQLMTMAIDATSPNDVEAIAWHRTQLGSLLFVAGRRKDAAREFDHAAYLFPDYPLALEGQARVAHSLGRNGEALALIERLGAGTAAASAIALNADVLRALGRATEAAKKDALAEAARILERASSRPSRQ